jgi:hypothetical protein
LSAPARFRAALEQGPGLLPVFGRFLAGRADLLPSLYLSELQKITPPQITPADTAGEPSSQLSDFQPLRSTVGCDVFTARYEQQRVVVELYRHTGPQDENPQNEKTWRAFRRGIANFRSGPESAVCRPSVIDEFRAWLDIQRDVERKRTMLGNLQALQDDYVCRFPRLIHDLQSRDRLVYEYTEGPQIGLSPETAAGVRNFNLLVEAMLEQSLMFSIIDAEFTTDCYVVLPDGHLGFRWLPAWDNVPVEWHHELMQYAACSVGGDTPRALQLLSRMAGGHDSYAAEQSLLDQLSSLQPDLKINMVTPESVTGAENYWRALTATSLRTPLFLQLFHRNLTLLGQMNGCIAPNSDVISESLWPVLARVLRFRIAEMLSTERNWEWGVSSGLFMISTVRQMTLALDKVRQESGDNSAAMGYRDADSHEDKLDRRAASLIKSAILLIVFLGSAYAALTASGDWLPFASKALAFAAGIGLCISVAGIK